MKDEVKKQYKKWIKTYEKDKINLIERYGTNYENLMNSFLNLCELKPGMKILDVGAGTGMTSITIAKALSNNCKILAIEPVDEMIEKAKTNIQREGLKDCISIKKGIGESLPYNNENFDLITCTFAIRHMEIENGFN